MAAGRWAGRGYKEGGDGAAVDAMRQLAPSVSMRGVVVIGEGEKTKVPRSTTARFGNGPGLNVTPPWTCSATMLMAKGTPTRPQSSRRPNVVQMFDLLAVRHGTRSLWARTP